VEVIEQRPRVLIAICAPVIGRFAPVLYDLAQSILRQRKVPTPNSSPPVPPLPRCSESIRRRTAESGAHTRDERDFVLKRYIHIEFFQLEFTWVKGGAMRS
jgi:hypothetical protein